MKLARFKEGQAIYWLARLTKAGDSPYRVPGYVASLTPKRIRIIIHTTTGQNLLRHVTAKRLQRSPMPQISLRAIREALSNCQLDQIRITPTRKVSLDHIPMKTNRARRETQR